MNGVSAIFKREFMGYFRTPVAYVFMAAFILAAVGLPWFIGRFFDANQASWKSSSRFCLGFIFF